MSKKLIQCKVCGAEIAKSAKNCPSCGAKNKKPFYKVWWFWVLVVFCLGILMADDNATGNDSTTGQKLSVQSNAQSSETTKPTATQEPKKEKYELVGDVKVESSEYSYYLVGVIKNNSGRELSYLQVTFSLYDKDGNQLGTAIDNVNNLEKDGTWKFKAMAFEAEEEIASYKLGEITGF